MRITRDEASKLTSEILVFLNSIGVDTSKLTDGHLVQLLEITRSHDGERWDSEIQGWFSVLVEIPIGVSDGFILGAMCYEKGISDPASISTYNIDRDNCTVTATLNDGSVVHFEFVPASEK